MPLSAPPLPAPPGGRRGGSRFGLRTYLVALVVIVLAPALLAGVVTAWQLGHAYRQDAEAGLRDASRSLAATLDRELEVVMTTAAGLADWHPLRGPEEATPQEMAEFHRRASATGEAFGGWVALVEADGTQILNTLRPLGESLPPERDVAWVNRALSTGNTVVSDLFTSTMSRVPMLAAFAPVLPRVETSARPHQVLILAFHPRHLSRLLAGRWPETVAALVHVRDGRIIAQSRGHEAALGQSVPAWAIAAIGMSETGLVQGREADGQDVVTTFHRLTRLPWATLVSLPSTAHEAAWRQPVERLVIAGAGLLAAALILATLLARSLLRPIRALASEAEALAAGHSVPRLSRPGRVAEFEALHAGLRRATEAIRSRAAAEGRVEAAEAAAAALRAERDRAKLYFDVAGAMLVVVGRDGEVQDINRRGLEVLGLARVEDAVGREWFSTFLPERLRDAVRARFQVAAATSGIEGPLQSYENAVLRADGEERLIAWRSEVLRDSSGSLVAIVASGEDITDSRAAEERQTLLLREVDHRAKNVLAVVQSIIRLTQASDPADFARTVEGRIGALARAHTLLARENWTGGDLRAVLEGELASHAAVDVMALAGPDVWLAPEAVQAISMVSHELTTNAVRHGALAGGGGRVTVDWAPLPSGELRLAWVERMAGGEPVVAPPRRGFGLRMAEATARSQLGGGIRFEWRPEGLRCTMTIAPDRFALRAAPNRARARAVESEAPLPRAAGAGECRVLVAEDEPLVALELETRLQEMGFTVVGPAATLQDAMQLATSGAPLQAAVLDVNLGGQAVFPVADLLVRRGVPVIFATGYGTLPGGWATSGGQGRTALLRKPLSRGALAGALRDLLDQVPPSDQEEDLPMGRAAPAKGKRL